MIDYLLRRGLMVAKHSGVQTRPTESAMAANAKGDASKQTLASSVYAQLRDEILTGGVRPDSRLNIRELCDRFSVGLSPMREALSRLSAEGLVQQSDNRGFSVMPVSVAELLDLTQARCWTNEIGLRESIAKGGAEWEESVLLSFHRLSRTPRHVEGARDRNPAWERAHRAFHRALIEGSGSPWLIDTCERLFDATERYRHLARIAGISRGDLEDEHRAIMQDAVDRNADRAVVLLTMHFRRTADLVQNVLGREDFGDRQPALAEAAG